MYNLFIQEASLSEPQQGLNERENGQPTGDSSERTIIKDLDCEVDIETSFADKIDLITNIRISEVFVKLTQQQIIYIFLHTMSKSQSSFEEARRFKILTPLQKFQFVGKLSLNRQESTQEIKLQKETCREYFEKI
jgi:hypothetical protein